MKPTRTPAASICFKLDGGTDENDLWVERGEDEAGSPVLVSTWEPSDEERDAIARGAAVELLVWGAGHPPVAISVGAPRFPFKALCVGRLIVTTCRQGAGAGDECDRPCCRRDD